MCKIILFVHGVTTYQLYHLSKKSISCKISGDMPMNLEERKYIIFHS